MATAFISNPPQASGNFSSGGSGRFKPLRKKSNGVTSGDSFNPFQPQYNRMAFNSSRDPVYAAFDYLEKQPLSQIASDFVKESIKYPLTKLFGRLTNAFA